MKNLSGGRLEDKWEVMEGVKFLRYLDVAFWLRFYQWCYFNMGVLLFSLQGTKSQRRGIKLCVLVSLCEKD